MSNCKTGRDPIYSLKFRIQHSLQLIISAANIYTEYTIQCKEMIMWMNFIWKTYIWYTISTFSTKIYLNSKIGGKRNSVFIEPLIDTTLHLSITHNSVIESFKHDTKGITYNDIAEKKNISCITFFENTIERFSSLYPEFDTTHYSKINAGKFLILVRK